MNVRGKADDVKFGFPSCRWLTRGKWTEAGTFSSLTGGYKPHGQKDAEKQFMKDVGGKVQEFDNVLASGFRVVTIQHGYSSRQQYCAVRDPRGFCVILDPLWMERAILRYGCSVDGDGNVSGRWYYRWINEKFEGLMHESTLPGVTVDDGKIQADAEKRVTLTAEDLEVGAVYDVYARDKDLESTRVVYIGDFDVQNFPSVRNFLEHGFNITEYFKRNVESYLNPDLEWLPWNVKTHVDRAVAATRAKTRQPVFIPLVDKIRPSNSNGLPLAERRIWYCDDLAGAPDEEAERSICFDFTQYAYGDIPCLIAGKPWVRKLLGKSKDQSIRIIAKKLPWARSANSGGSVTKFLYSSPSEYREIPLDTLQKGFGALVAELDKVIAEILKLAPVKRPEDMAEWSKAVNAWKESWRKRHSYMRW